MAGSTHTFTKTYYSNVSQADAQAQADADATFDALGQAYANETGHCDAEEFHSLVLNKTVSRAITTLPDATSADVIIRPSMDNATVIVNTLPGIALQTLNSDSSTMLTVATAGDFEISVVGSGTITQTFGTNFYMILNFFLEAGGEKIALAPDVARNWGIGNPDVVSQFLIVSAGGSGSQTASTPYSFSKLAVVRTLAIGDTVKLYCEVGCNYDGITGTFVWQTTSMDIVIKKI